MSKIKELKELLKEKASHIKQERQNARTAKLQGCGYGRRWQDVYDSIDYRHYHIAYCELRGKTREQIEKPRQDNLPNENKIRNIKFEYGYTIEEINAYVERKARRGETLRSSQA